VAVAFSGGVDSTYLLAEAVRVLGPERVVAITAVSPTLSAHEREETVRWAAHIGVRHILRDSAEFANPLFSNNGPDRCYHCKQALFALCEEVIATLDPSLSWTLVYGANLDDLGDDRPGMEAARQRGVRAPLLEAGLGKAEIRRRSAALGLPTADKAPFACLASRVPTFTPITLDRLRRVEDAETVLRSHGFRLYRVRDRGEVARIEVGPDEQPRLEDTELRGRLIPAIQATGFARVEFDPHGYRTGALFPGSTSTLTSTLTLADHTG
jgi:uncharacterized protein